MKKFYEEMNKLIDSTTEMGALASELIEESVNSLCNKDVDLAGKVIDKFDRITFLDNIIEEESLRILTLYQPAAIDMRTVATVLKTITYLERIGKYSKNIAKATIYLNDKPEVCGSDELYEMCQVAKRMVQISVSALTSRDISNYDVLLDMERSLDKMRDDILEYNVKIMQSNPESADVCTYHISVSRYLERVGDHTCKIAEKVAYMVTGKRINFDS